jgi:hypothetical protein
MKNIFLSKELALAGLHKSHTLAQTFLSSCVFNITAYISLSVRELLLFTSNIVMILVYVSLSAGVMNQIEDFCSDDKLTGRLSEKDCLPIFIC